MQRVPGRRRVLLAALLWSVTYLVVVTFHTGSRTAIWVDDLGNLIAPLVASGLCLGAARRCQGRARSSWALFAAFAGTWALGQVAWCWYELVVGTAVPFPGLPDVGYVACVPFLLAALLMHPSAPRPAFGLLRLVADGILVGASLLAVSWRLALGDAYAAAGAPGLAQLLGLAYPALDVVVLTLLVLVGLRARSATDRPLAWVAACLASGAVGHTVYGLLAQSGSWQPGNPIDAAWGVGFVFLALGAHLDRGAARVDVPERPPTGWRAALPFVPLVLLAALAINDALREKGTDDVSRGLGFVIFASVLLRQGLALAENSRLSRGLEVTVAERTRELSRTTERLQAQAWTDSLTGLPNRARLFDRMASELLAGPVVVALLDLDGFKQVNDSLGHDAGDRLLEVLGHRLSHGLPAGVLPARLGGDEFAFLLPGPVTERDAWQLGHQILQTLTVPVDLGARTLALTGSVGLVLSAPGDTPEALLRNADVAMYAAKDAGKDQLCVFVPSMRDELLARVALEADLRQALLAGDIRPWFQPIVDLGTGRLTGVEALARWTKDGVAVSPGVFVPLAEESGLVGHLGRQVLRTACAHAATWNLTGRLTLSVNLSAVQLADGDLVDVVREALRDTGLDPSCLVLEITETVLMGDVVSIGPRLAALRELGVRIALDDFGTGYSALGYLQKIPVDIVKIDRCFVQDLHLGARQGALAAAVMTLAEALDLDVVAEGIELPAQAARLRELGCRLGQGFLYAAALPPEELTRRWEKQEVRTSAHS